MTDESALLGSLSTVMPDNEIVELTAESIRIESHRSAPGHESGYARFLHQVLLREGIAAELRDVRDGRLNVIGTLPGAGGGRNLMFNGHTDTVPPGTMADAFAPKIVDGAITGRGSCDMKGGLIAQLCALIAIKRAGLQLGGGLIFTGVIAEEDSTNLGSLDIVANGPRADMVVVAEPTGLRVAVAHKGFDYYRIDVPGIAGHSSQPDKGINAIYRAAAVVTAIQNELAPSLKAAVHPVAGSATINVSSIKGYAMSEAATAFGGGPIDKPAGGTVPDSCVITLDHRRLPRSDRDAMLLRLQSLAEAAAGPGPMVTAHFTPACPELESHPPLDTDPDHELVRQCGRLAQSLAGVSATPIGVPYWSDGALFNTGWQVPTIVFGPGDIALAHSDKERLPIDELVKATRINALLAASLLGIDG